MGEAFGGGLTSLVGDLQNEILEIVAVGVARRAGEGQLRRQAGVGRLHVGGRVARALVEGAAVVASAGEHGRARGQPREEHASPESHCQVCFYKEIHLEDEIRFWGWGGGGRGLAQCLIYILLMTPRGNKEPGSAMGTPLSFLQNSESQLLL